MQLDDFIQECGYIVDQVLDDPKIDYRVIMDNGDTHDIWFYWKDGIIRYEAYNQLDDSSVILSDEELQKLEEWFKNLEL